MLGFVYNEMTIDRLIRAGRVLPDYSTTDNYQWKGLEHGRESFKTCGRLS
jgi:hypothetical protein